MHLFSPSRLLTTGGKPALMTTSGTLFSIMPNFYCSIEGENIIKISAMLRTTRDAYSWYECRVKIDALYTFYELFVENPERALVIYFDFDVNRPLRNTPDYASLPPPSLEELGL